MNFVANFDFFAFECQFSVPSGFMASTFKMNFSAKVISMQSESTPYVGRR